jgi:hypothetical protein
VQPPTLPIQLATVGPGDAGTITAVRNGANVGNVTLNTNASPSANGTYGGNLVITNNFDYNQPMPTLPPGSGMCSVPQYLAQLHLLGGMKFTLLIQQWPTPTHQAGTTTTVVPAHQVLPAPQ